jgi:hypothetical protein
MHQESVLDRIVASLECLPVRVHDLADPRPWALIGAAADNAHSALT